MWTLKGQLGGVIKNTEKLNCIHKRMRKWIQPLSCGAYPVILTAVETVSFLVEVGLHTFLLKLMELLTIFMAQEEFWGR